MFQEKPGWLFGKAAAPTPPASSKDFEKAAEQQFQRQSDLRSKALEAGRNFGGKPPGT